MSYKKSPTVKIKHNDKIRGIAMPFNWIFALIVGGVILFLAIYGTTQIIKTGENQLSTETALRVVTLLNPLSSGLASGKSYNIKFSKDVRSYYSCQNDLSGGFGRNKIAFAEKTIGDNYGVRGEDINTKKYVFAEVLVEGKTLNIFSKPIYMPFKIDDLIMISSKDYCFYQAPDEILDEVIGLNIENINIANEFNELDNCAGVLVCFGSNSNCDISVFGMCEDFSCKSKYDYGKVIKSGGSLFYYDSLIYGAIFSSPEIYECNVLRLMNKFENLGRLYLDKINLVGQKQCNSNIGADLIQLIEISNGVSSSSDLFIFSQSAKLIDNKNNRAACKLY